MIGIIHQLLCIVMVLVVFNYILPVLDSCSCWLQSAINASISRKQMELSVDEAEAQERCAEYAVDNKNIEVKGFCVEDDCGN